jgi:uncharacterized SAM-binding protein YcdF (DUF218 family)
VTAPPASDEGRWRRPWRRPWLIAVAATASAFWLVGFFWFIAATSIPPVDPPVADGIVVLTGGAERIAEGLRLLAAHKGRALLVSGVGSKLDLALLARHTGLDPAVLAGHVTLGHAALTTRGNAAEAALWARQNGFHALILVTATYHMPRARAEFARAMPDVTLYAAAVVPPAMHGLWRWPTLKLLAVEYSKYLVVRARLMAWPPAPVTP